MGPNEHSTDPATEHVPCDGFAEMTDSPAGSASDTLASLAESGPWFCTTNVNIT
jgi:hypothetical protein